MALLPSGRVQVAQAAHSSSLSPLVAELTVGGRCLLALDLDQRFGAASRGARGPDLLGRSLVAGAIGAERRTPWRPLSVFYLGCLRSRQSRSGWCALFLEA
jgi:hypothetical protein